jgi:hypothetical protein
VKVVAAQAMGDLAEKVESPLEHCRCRGDGPITRACDVEKWVFSDRS